MFTIWTWRCTQLHVFEKYVGSQYLDDHKENTLSTVDGPDAQLLDLCFRREHFYHRSNVLQMTEGGGSVENELKDKVPHIEWPRCTPSLIESLLLDGVYRYSCIQLSIPHSLTNKKLHLNQSIM